MNELTRTRAEVIPARDLPPTLFNDFIRYIDRGEKTTRTYITNLRQFAAWLKYASIARPTRQDVISYRDYLSAEHDAIQLAPVNGWTYRPSRISAAAPVSGWEPARGNSVPAGQPDCSSKPMTVWNGKGRTSGIS